MNYLIDTSWILYQGYFALHNENYEYSELFYLSKKLEKILSNKNDNIYLCIDGSNTKGKKLLKEEYKKNRDQKDKYNVYKGLYTYINKLNNPRINIYFNNDYESDELLYSLSKQLVGDNLIISGDCDLLQSLDENTYIENNKHNHVNEKNYYILYDDKFKGVPPKRLPIFRAIVGDTSDNLKPVVSRFPHKLAAFIAKNIEYNYITVPDKEKILALISLLNDNEKKWCLKLIDNYNRFILNFDIMKLNILNLISIREKYTSDEVELPLYILNKINYINSL